MGVSTNGQICYGIVFEEGYEFPWDVDWEDDIDEWWIVQSGWTWDKEKPFDEDGNYRSGLDNESPEVQEYFTSRHEWARAHPCPVVMVNYQSSEWPAYLLAIPESVVTANRGYPQLIDIGHLTEGRDWESILVNFCREHRLMYDAGPRWYLSSYWG